jgi:hypothetical protein
VCRAELSYTLVKGIPQSALWPVAVAAIVRLTVWAIIPGERFASDEHGYVTAGVVLATRGEQDLFWPPMTGWIVALVTWLAPAAPLKVLRLLWIAMDLANLVLIATLADRVARLGLPERRSRMVAVAAWAYALYLPAISHAQFVTSEIPALLMVLAALVLTTSPVAAWNVASGVVLGALVLVRANLLPLVVMMPGAALVDLPRPVWLRRTAVIGVIAGMVVGVAIARNWMVYGEPSLSRNAAYNLYIGNRSVYAEDLDLFHPRATPEQIEFRRQFFAGTLQYPTGTSAELQAAALQWIAQHPGQFLRRATGRLARVFAPKTDVLELIGGEAAANVFSVRSLTLLGLANLQWAWALFAGALGLAVLFDRDRRFGLLFLSTVAGSVALCLIAIAKPRYSFVFDPLLIVGATLATLVAVSDRQATWRRHRAVLAAAYAFLAWGWIAWTIFALTSRLA